MKNDTFFTSFLVTAVLMLAAWIPPAASGLIINEIMYNPNAVSDSNGEWFEIYNPDAAMDLQGYAVSDSDPGNKVLISSPLPIPSHGYLVFGRKQNLQENGGVAVDSLFSFPLNNDGDTLSIYAPDGSIVDTVSYGAGFPSVNGASIAFSGTGDNGNGANWTDSSATGLSYGDGDFGTPGKANTTTVPEPGSWILIGSGLAGLLGASQKRLS